MSDSVGMYLNEIGAVALLNAEEERELSRTIELGGSLIEQAVETLARVLAIVVAVGRS